MKAIELETIITQSGTLQIPLDYQQYYGKSAKIIVLFPEIEKETVVDLIPSNWQSLFDSLDKFSDDFMEQREQPALQERESLFE